MWVLFGIFHHRLVLAGVIGCLAGSAAPAIKLVGWQSLISRGWAGNHSKTKLAGKAIAEDPVFRQQMARSYVEVMALKYHGLRNFSNQLEGNIPGPEGSIGKLLWSEPNQMLTELAVDMQGPSCLVMDGSPWSTEDGNWQFQYLRSKGNTIEAGTSEIQSNIIGERVLGLPKDVSRTKPD